MLKPKLPVDFFNPNVQRTTMLERDDWFVPLKEGFREEKEPVVEVMNRRRDKVKRVVKTILIVLGVAAFIVLGYYFFKDFFEPNPPSYHPFF